MHNTAHTSRPPLTPARLSHLLADAARTAGVKRKVPHGMSTHKQEQAGLFRTVIADWFSFVARKLDPAQVDKQLVEVKAKEITRRAVADLMVLKASKRPERQRFIGSAIKLKQAELRWLSYLDYVTKDWRKSPSEEASLALESLTKYFLQYSGTDPCKILRHGYGSAANTYWGLVAVGEKLRTLKISEPASEADRRVLSEDARHFTLVLSSLHIEHLREVDLELRGGSSVADYRPHLFQLDGGRLLIRQSAALNKPPETGTSIATGCPATTATAEGHGSSVASNLLFLFEKTYMGITDSN